MELILSLRNSLTSQWRFNSIAENVNTLSGNGVQYFTVIFVMALLSVMALLPVHTAVAQQSAPCVIERGTVSLNGNRVSFTASASGPDTTIRCEGDLSGIANSLYTKEKYPNQIRNNVWEILSPLFGLTDPNVDETADLFAELNAILGNTGTLLLDLGNLYDDDTTVEWYIEDDTTEKVILIGTVDNLPALDPRGINIHRNSGTANPIVVESRASITARGDHDDGLHVSQNGEAGRIEVRNFNEITTTGVESHGIRVSRNGQPGAAEILAVNEADGVIHAAYKHADDPSLSSSGMRLGAWKSGHTEGRNYGRISAGGWGMNANSLGFAITQNWGFVESGSHGLYSLVLSRAGEPSLNNTASAETVNHISGEITTTAAGAHGMYARIHFNSDANADDPANAGKTFNAVAVNDGQISVSGDGSRGVYSAATGTPYGDASITNTSTVKATGANGVGLSTYTSGHGNSVIRMKDGTVTAGVESSKFGIGLYGQALTSTVSDESNSDVDVSISVFGNSRIFAFSGMSDDENTAYVETKGIGIAAQTEDASGNAEVTVSDCAAVVAQGGLAVAFLSGGGNLAADGSACTQDNGGVVLIGDIDFSQGDVADTFSMDSALVIGDIRFNGGADTIDFNSNWTDVQGNIDFGDGADTLNVWNSNTLARVNNVSNVELVDINNGNLVIRGHLDVGTGVVEIHNAGRLSFEFGDVSSDPTDHGSLTAGTVEYRSGSSEEIFVQLSEDLSDSQTQQVLNVLPGRNWNLMDVTTVDRSSTSATIPVKSEQNDSTRIEAVGMLYVDDGTVQFNAESTGDIGKVKLPNLNLDLINGQVDSPRGTARGGKGSSRITDRELLVGIGLLGVLLGELMDEDEADAEFSSLTTPYSQVRFSRDARMPGSDNSSESGAWARAATTAYQSYGLSALEANGDQFGWNLYNTDGHFLNAFVVPNASVHSNLNSVSASGALYSLTGGWRDAQRYLSMGVSYGKFDARSSIVDPTINGTLNSNSAFEHTQLRLGAGQTVDFAGASIRSSTSLFAGKVKHAAHEAQNSVMIAQIPGYEQRYFGAKLGMKITSSDVWELPKGASMKPHLKFSTARIGSSASSAMRVRQSDRLGVLEYGNSARIRQVPQRLNAFSLAADVNPSGNRRGNWRFGYGGVEADGEHQYVAFAAYRARF